MGVLSTTVAVTHYFELITNKKVTFVVRGRDAIFL